MSLHSEWVQRIGACLFDSACRKCKKRLTFDSKGNPTGVFDRLPMLVSRYVCECGYHNDLTTRKGWKEYRAEWIEKHQSK